MLTLLLACTGPEPEDSGDTSTDSGTDTEIQIEADVGILVDGDTAGLSVGLVHLTFGDEGLIVGGSLLTADAAAEVLVEAGTPDDADFFYPDGDTDPALELAVYAPVLFADDNGDGAADDGDTILGVGGTWAVFKKGEMVGDTVPGLVDGWNAYTPDFVNEGGEVGDPLAIPLAANLAPRTDLTLSGSYAGEVTENVRLTAIPGPMLGEEGVVVEEFIYDGAVDGDTWTMELSGAPPSDHFEALDGIGYGALEVPVTYQDEGSGDFGPGDQPLYAACSGDQAVILIWVDGPETLSEAMTFGVFGFSVGWSAMLSTEGGGPEAVPLDSLGDLVIDGSCSL